jgi:hypothetical protein
MPLHGRKNKNWSASSGHKRMAAAAAAIGTDPSVGCLTAASKRMNIPPVVGIPNPNLQICLATPSKSERMLHDANQF